MCVIAAGEGGHTGVERWPGSLSPCPERVAVDSNRDARRGPIAQRMSRLRGCAFRLR
jgi:hypothetical protein